MCADIGGWWQVVRCPGARKLFTFGWNAGPVIGSLGRCNAWTFEEGCEYGAPVSEQQELGNPADDSGTVGGRAGQEFPDGGPPTWVTLRQAAAAVRVSSKAIRRAIKAGTIEGRRSDNSENAPWHVRLENARAAQASGRSPREVVAHMKG